MYGQQFLVKSTHRNPIRKMSLLYKKRGEIKVSARARTKERVARGLQQSGRLASTSQFISLVLVCLQVHNLICQLLQHFSGS
jgi:hypothetical protein